MNIRAAAGACILFSGLGWAIAANAQTDAAISVYGAFSGRQDSSRISISPANAAGGIVELRHIRNPLVGYEATYSFNRANQSYASTSTPPCPVNPAGPCGPQTTSASIPANAHEITGDWIVSLKVANLRPFALAGGGLLLDAPAAGTVTTTMVTTGCDPLSGVCGPFTSTSTTGTSTSVKGVFVYGGGLDWGLVPHIGLRLQYRGNVYTMPELLKGFSSTGSFTHTAEPMAGVYLRF